MSKKDEALKMAISYIQGEDAWVHLKDEVLDTCNNALKNHKEIDAKSFQMGFDCSVDITDEEIHNIWLHMQGKSEGLIEAGSKCDFPVMYSKALIEFMKGKLV